MKKIKNTKILILISKWKFAEFNKELNNKIKNFNSNNNFPGCGEIIYLSEILGFNFSKIQIPAKDKELYFKWVKSKQAKKYKKADEFRKILLKKELI